MSLPSRQAGLYLRGRIVIAPTTSRHKGNVLKPLSLFLLLLLAQLSYSQSQDSTFNSIEENKREFHGANDTTHITRKDFDKTEIQKLKSDPDLNYKEAPTVAESLWDRFLSWIDQFLSRLFENATMTDVGRILMYSIGVIALIIIIMALLKVNALRVFYGNADQRKFNHQLFHENIHEMDFEKLIQNAVEQNDFRLSTRLIFLFALKLLSEKQLIQWQPGKTNHEYVDELKTGELKTGLNELSFYFDYAWYGHFTISQDQYHKVHGLFNTWKTKINQA